MASEQVLLEMSKISGFASEVSKASRLTLELSKAVLPSSSFQSEGKAGRLTYSA
jgi:hypothetical protein